jgi:hypothetical protein
LIFVEEFAAGKGKDETEQQIKKRKQRVATKNMGMQEKVNVSEPAAYGNSVLATTKS